MSELRQGNAASTESAGLEEMSASPQGAQSAAARFLEHYGLFEQPFGVTPDPRFLYLGPKHREALAALEYGTETGRGFLALIAKPGMGKTSLLFQYLERLRGRARTAYVFQTDGDSRDLMRMFLSDLGIETSGKDMFEMRVALQKVLVEEMEAGRRLVLVIDEAQMLDTAVLESLRLLSNFETPAAKLMQIVLAGQPELAERLARPALSQFRQRISFFISLERLTPEEVHAYIEHRLWVSGHNGAALFTPGAQLLIAERSEGIPRNINNICFSAMSLGLAINCKRIDRDMTAEVLSDLGFGLPEKRSESSSPGPRETQFEVRPSLSVSLANASSSRRLLPRVFALAGLLFALGWMTVRQDRAPKKIRISPPATLSGGAVSARPFGAATAETSKLPNSSDSTGGREKDE
jgi:type II secretory pathway predicted ATPase ExeA